MKMNATALILVLLLCLNNFVFGQNYLWPTNASNHLTSSFCEWRPGHYHSAIDIKTWNQEGYPCYAIEDGRIYKIRVSPFGYGKVIYLKLNDGNFAVYAHLQKFTKKLEKQIRAKQLESEKYRLSWSPKNLYVKKGEIIGYTGSTGIGTPHLHFEIRNSKEHPLNPLAFYSNVIDNIRPRLQKIALIPLSENSEINSSFYPQIYDLTYIKDGIYVIKHPLKIKDRIGLAIKGYDQADGVFNKFAFYQTVLSIEGEEVFQISYDKMDFASTSFINTEIYYPLLAKSKEVFHKLYIEPYNILPFYKRKYNSNGSIFVNSDPVSFTISVKDFHGNTSIIKGELLPADDNQIIIKQNFYKDSWAYIKFNLKSFNFLSFSSSSDLNNWKEVSYFEILERKFKNPSHILFTKVKIPDLKHKFLRIDVKSVEGNKISKIITLTKTDTRQNPSLTILGKNLVLESNQFDINFYTKNENEIVTLPAKHGMHGFSNAILPVKQISGSDLVLGFDSGDSIIWNDYSNIKLFVPQKNKTVSWFDSSLIISSSYDSFFDTTLIQAQKYTPDSLNLELPFINEIFEVLPDDIALHRGVSVLLKTDSLSDSKHWGVYRLNGENKISLVSTEYDSIKNGFSFRTKSLGKFVIAQDTVAPILEIQKPVSEKIYSKNPDILFTTKDDHSGIGHEKNISITVDNQFVLPEWDPEEDRVYAKIDKLLAKGDHKLVIQIEDLAGNKTEKIIQFRIN